MVQVVALVLLVRTFIVSPFAIPSPSMMPTLHDGDILLVAKWPYGYSRHSLPFATPAGDGKLGHALPRRGDIVVFRHPRDDTVLIKRVIGLPGDRVAMRGGSVVLNGTRLPQTPEPASACVTPCEGTVAREALDADTVYPTLQGRAVAADTFAGVTVAADRLFVMGDNRDNSLDSRFAAEAGGGVGQVPVGQLIGRAEIIVFSIDGSARWHDPASWLRAIRWNRIGHRLDADE